MKTLGNILWVIFGGFFWAVGLFFSGILLCITILFIPVGIQYFKLAGFVLWPFGKECEKVDNSLFKKIINVLWAIFGGWESALMMLLTGAILCITIIGIPFGKQYFKMAKFVFLPLGRKFIKTGK